MIDFGMPTLLETKTPEQWGRLCQALGLKFVELNMNLPQFQLNTVSVSQLQEIGEEYQIFYTIHLDENLNFCDFNPYVAQAYRRTVAETIQLAKELGVPLLNMHLSSGVHFTLPDKKAYLFSEYKEWYLKSTAEFRELCEDAIGNSQILISIENCSGFLPFQKEALEILLASPAFGLTFDIGHNHGCGGRDESYILQNKERLRHMHVHDALQDRDHLPLGEGELNIEKYLTLAQRQNCRVVLETKTIEGLKSSVYWLKNRGYLPKDPEY